MALDNIGLGRLLGIFSRPLKQRLAIVRADARKAVLKERKLATDGPDFYVPFWSDAKGFFFGRLNLRDATRARVLANRSRRRLYPILLERFLRWHASVSPDEEEWKEAIEQVFGSCTGITKEAKVRVNGILGWKDARGRSHLVYPYFSQDLALSPRMARLGRWAMCEALKSHEVETMRILDVLRAQEYDNDNCPLVGDEEERISERYTQLLLEWESQRRLLKSC